MKTIIRTDAITAFVQRVLLFQCFMSMVQSHDEQLWKTSLVGKIGPR